MINLSNIKLAVTSYTKYGTFDIQYSEAERRFKIQDPCDASMAYIYESELFGLSKGDLIETLVMKMYIPGNAASELVGDIFEFFLRKCR